MVPHIMAACDDIVPVLSAFHDGELPPHTMKEVAWHLATCRNCELAVEGYSALGQLLRDAAPEPSLDGLAAAVQAKISKDHFTFRARVSRWLETQQERLAGIPVIAGAMTAAAIVTVLVVTPFARNIVGAGSGVVQVASRDAQSLAHEAAKAPAAVSTAINGEPGTIISKLETSNPDVAVWSEPSQDTTVIWLPDQQP